MKKIIITSMLSFFIYSCHPRPDDEGKDPQFGFSKVRIGKCHYAIYIKTNASAMVHAGDCDNIDHKTDPIK